MEEMDNENETPEEFLTKLGNSLAVLNGIDVKLAEILKTYLLKVAPGQDAIAYAKAAIVKLATERARLQEAKTSDG